MSENSYLHEFCAQVSKIVFLTCAQNSWRYEFSDIFAHTVVISRKTVKSGKNTFATFVHRTRGDTSFVTFSLIQLE